MVKAGRWRAAAAGSDGFTFVELLVVCTILLILASAVMPLARVTVQRQREAELRRALREMRTAIDKFKDAADAGMIPTTELKANSEGYPPDLETLVDGRAQDPQLPAQLDLLLALPAHLGHGHDRRSQDHEDRGGGHQLQVGEAALAPGTAHDSLSAAARK